MGLPILAILALFPRPAHEDLEIQIARVTREIAAEPKRADLYLQRGELHRAHGDWASAKADYARARAAEPGLAETDLALGRMWLAAGDAAQARAAADRFLACRKDHPDGLVIRGRALIALGRRLEGAAELDRALERAPSPNPDVVLDRSQALRAEGPAHREEALRGLDEGIRKLGPVVTLVAPAIDLELELGRVEAALSRVDGLAARSERKDPWLARRGEILRAAGRTVEAREAFRAALSAIEALPPARRGARTTRELESKVRAELEATHEDR